MKNIFENEAVFTAHATIGAGYYMLEILNKELLRPVSNIIIMVDKATGYDDHQHHEFAKRAIIILEDIIEAKKVIEVDYKRDEELWEQLNELINTGHTQKERIRE